MLRGYCPRCSEDSSPGTDGKGRRERERGPANAALGCLGAILAAAGLLPKGRNGRGWRMRSRQGCEWKPEQDSASIE